MSRNLRVSKPMRYETQRSVLAARRAPGETSRISMDEAHPKDVQIQENPDPCVTSRLAIMDDLLKHQVACGLLARAGRVLLVHRSSSKRWYPNVWDFPGGHLEPGETSSEALVRELREELDIEIAPPVGPALLTIQTLEVRIDIWKVVDWDGAVTNAAPDEHDTFGWFTPEEAESLDLADAEYPALIELALT